MEIHEEEVAQWAQRQRGNEEMKRGIFFLMFIFNRFRVKGGEKEEKWVKERRAESKCPPSTLQSYCPVYVFMHALLILCNYFSELLSTVVSIYMYLSYVQSCLNSMWLL